MIDYGDDIYTEPDADPDTLANLGPSRALAGIWEGRAAWTTIRPRAGSNATRSSSTTSSSPSTRQTNGPQLFYGLRYHTHIVKPGEVETFHDQVGYWLWEPADEHRDADPGDPPRPGLLAAGPAEADATEFELTAARRHRGVRHPVEPVPRGSFRTLSYRIHVTVNGDGTWSYEEEGRAADPGPRRAVPPHRPQYAHPGRRTDAQPAGAVRRRSFTRNDLKSRRSRRQSVGTGASTRGQRDVSQCVLRHRGPVGTAGRNRENHSTRTTRPRRSPPVSVRARRRIW